MSESASVFMILCVCVCVCTRAQTTGGVCVNVCVHTCSNYRRLVWCGVWQQYQVQGVGSWVESTLPGSSSSGLNVWVFLVAVTQAGQRIATYLTRIAPTHADQEVSLQHPADRTRSILMQRQEKR